MRALVIGLALAAGALCLALVKPAPPGAVVVPSADIALAPGTVKARVGDIIEWVNEGSLDHPATADEKVFGLPIAIGGSGHPELKRPGIVADSCPQHSSMGAIEVR